MRGGFGTGSHLTGTLKRLGKWDAKRFHGGNFGDRNIGGHIVSLSAGSYIPLLNIRLFDGEEMKIDGEFNIVFSRRCAGPGVDPIHGLQMDILVKMETKIIMLKNGKEVRRYG